MDIKVNNLGYNFDNEGNTAGVSVGFSGNDNRNYLTATIVLEQKDIPADTTLDDLSKKQLTEIARNKLSEYAQVEEAPKQ